MFVVEMNFYITKTSDGLYHVQNAVKGQFGQHHVHDEESFNKWKEGIEEKNLKFLKGECNCGLKNGDCIDGLPPS